MQLLVITNYYILGKYPFNNSPTPKNLCVRKLIELVYSTFSNISIFLKALPIDIKLY